MNKVKPGSPFLFTLIKFLTIIFGISALALAALGIWLWRQFKAFNIIEIAFISLGIFEFLLVLFIWTAKTGKKRLRLSLLILTIIFLLQLSAVIVCFATGEKIINKVAEDSKQEIEELKKYLNIIVYYCIGTLAIILLEMMLVKCYIGSLRNNNAEFDYKFLDEGGNKLTLDQKNQLDQEKIQDKYDQKRKELYEKYPKYR